jgi:hypothetical protein
MGMVFKPLPRVALATFGVGSDMGGWATPENR